MRQNRAITGVLTLALVGCLTGSAAVRGQICAPTEANLFHGSTTTDLLASTPDVVRVQLSEGVFAERLSGAAALAHLRNLMSRHPSAMTASRANLTGRGFAPTDVVYVERTIRLASDGSEQYGSSFSLAQDSGESNSDGEILFWSWDDGDDATWEGTIYMEMYSNGAASTWDGQINASNSQHDWVFYQKTWTSGSGGPRPVDFRTPGEAPPLPGRVPQVGYAVLSSGADHGSSPNVTVSWMGWAVCWRSCVVTGCGTAAVGCIRVGPGWPGCFAAWCIGAEIFCGVGCYLSN